MGDRLRASWTRLSGRLILLYAVLAIVAVSLGVWIALGLALRPGDRTRADANLAVAFPDLDATGRKDLLRRSAEAAAGVVGCR